MRWNGATSTLRDGTRLLAALAAATLPLVLGGCGEQDLYKPPSSPYSVVSRLPLPSASEDVCVLGSRAFVAGGEAGLLVVDLSDPQHPRLVNTVNTPKSAVGVEAASTPASQGVVDYAFLADGTEGIDVFDVSAADTISTLPYFDTYDARGLCISLPEIPSNPYSVYVADSWRGLWRLDSLTGVPGALYMAGRTYTRGSAEAVAVAGGFAYVADDEMGVAVIDARIPVAMGVVSSCDTDGNAQGIAVLGDHAFVADGENGLVIMSIHLGDPPAIIGRLALAGDCLDVEARDNLAFLAAKDGGLHIVDIGNPSQPQLLGTVSTPYATGVALSKTGLLVASDRTEGLIILGGPSAFRDLTPPAAVGDLAALPRDSTSVLLRWHAPGDDFYQGTAAQYEIRYSAVPITVENWATATASAGVPAPARSGILESFEVTGLIPATQYYFACKTADAVPNWSSLSNIASAITYAGNVPPSLTDPSFLPQGAAPGEPIRFQVTYTDADNDPPGRADVVINGESIPLLTDDSEFEDGAVFFLEKSFPQGTYEHYFAFDDGHVHPVATAVTPGPWIGDIFVMGSPQDEPGRDVDESEHLIVLGWEVEISDHEVTQAEYDSVMHANPSRFVGPDHPVENVAWFDAVGYCNARSILKGLTPAYTIIGDSVACDFQANGYRLPTEAEWERACRGGSRTAFARGPLTVETCLSAASRPDSVLDTMGWYCGNATNTTHDVRLKLPNESGLYDMHGNVWEWCWDWYSVNGVIGDATGPARGVQRVIRGGSWYYFARDCRSASRAPYWPNSKDDIVGFRVARTIR